MSAPQRAINDFLVRHAELVPRDAGYVTTGAAEPRQNQHFVIVAGTSVQPMAGYAHGVAPHAFDVLGLRRAPGEVSVPHCCDTAEVLVAHIGRWRVVLGVDGEAGSIELAEGDVASIPARAYRRVEKLDDGTGFLFVVRGSLATPEDVGGRFTDCAVAAAAIVPNRNSPLAAEAVQEAGVVATGESQDGFRCGPITGWWPHGFTLRRLTLDPGGYVPMHHRGETEVLMLHEGTLEVSTADAVIMMGAGDLLTVPARLNHALRNTTSRRLQAFVVRGSEDPAMPLFESMPLRS